MKLSAFLVSAASLLLVVQAWDFEIFDGDCFTSSDLETGTTDKQYVTQYPTIPSHPLSLHFISLALQD